MNEEKMILGISSFLEGMGLDLNDQHLEKTPQRVMRAWRDSFASGYSQNAEDILSVEFDEEYSSMVVVKDIPYISYCSHHLVPFIGTAKIGYIPDGKVTGLSKLARVLDMYAKRLQVQERLTEQVANTIQKILEPKGVGVVLEGQHMCMTHRGVQKPGSNTITSCLLGEMMDNSCTRQEFLSF